MAPEIRFPEVRSLCSLGPRPNIVTGYLRWLLIQLFSQASNIESPDLKSVLWQAVNTANGIEIESITRWKPETTGKRPAIIIKRNDWKVLRLGIDDRMMGFQDDGGIHHYAAYLEGSHTLFALSTNGGEAEILGAEVYRNLMQFSSVIRSELELHRFMLISVGGMFKLEEAKEVLAVPITVAYALEDTWRLLPRAPILKKIELSNFLP